MADWANGVGNWGHACRNERCLAVFVCRNSGHPTGCVTACPACSMARHRHFRIENCCSEAESGQVEAECFCSIPNHYAPCPSCGTHRHTCSYCRQTERARVPASASRYNCLCSEPDAHFGCYACRDRGNCFCPDCVTNRLYAPPGRLARRPEAAVFVESGHQWVTRGKKLAPVLVPGPATPTHPLHRQQPPPSRGGHDVRGYEDTEEEGGVNERPEAIIRVIFSDDEIVDDD